MRAQAPPGVEHTLRETAELRAQYERLREDHGVRVLAISDAAAMVGIDSGLALPAGVPPWLGPLVEVVTERGRIGYGPVTPGDVPGLLAAGLTTAADHPLRLGPTAEIEGLGPQTRPPLPGVGGIDPPSACFF